MYQAAIVVIILALLRCIKVLRYTSCPIILVDIGITGRCRAGILADLILELGLK